MEVRKNEVVQICKEYVVLNLREESGMCIGINCDKCKIFCNKNRCALILIDIFPCISTNQNIKHALKK